MKARLVRLAFALAAACCMPAAVKASDAALLNSCWGPDALAGKPGEKIARKHNHSFDVAAPEAVLPDTPGDPPAGAIGAVRRVKLPPGKKLIALTFDLCEQPGEIAGYDGAIIDYLRQENIKATFFAGGKWIRSHEERTRQLMSDPLFELGNHSEAHRNLRLLSGTKLYNEVAGPQRAYEAARQHLAATQCAINHPGAMQGIAPRMTLFRFPYGACNAAALREVHQQGLLAIQWDLSTGDPSPLQSASAIIRAMARAKPGSIIINHANGRGWNTAAALPFAIEQLRKKGFEFVTVSELLAAGEPVISADCYDNRPGDTNRYDNLARGLKLLQKPKTRLQ
ncbi:MAG: polysaccharide deacetylase family protein [Hyphomicrobium sp.]|jgi:peptidoglycan/xylan/chitin deacetylase (PgdA/CDA1 family)